jgi:hypothetical protein
VLLKGSEENPGLKLLERRGAAADRTPSAKTKPGRISLPCETARDDEIKKEAKADPLLTNRFGMTN